MIDQLEPPLAKKLLTALTPRPSIDARGRMVFPGETLGWGRGKHYEPRRYAGAVCAGQGCLERLSGGAARRAQGDGEGSY